MALVNKEEEEEEESGTRGLRRCRPRRRPNFVSMREMLATTGEGRAVVFGKKAKIKEEGRGGS